MSKDKKIEVPEMEYWDDAKTKPKFKIDVWNNGSLEYLACLDKSGGWNGLTEAWRKDGSKLLEQNWVNNKRNGLEIRLYSNGKKEYEINWVNDKKKYEENYLNNKKHGECNYFDEDGKLTRAEIWNDGNLK